MYWNKNIFKKNKYSTDLWVLFKNICKYLKLHDASIKLN